ncbi:MAG: hypothetical protein RIF33_07190 [Cyclobacteriaceae bacterium]
MINRIVSLTSGKYTSFGFGLLIFCFVYQYTFDSKLSLGGDNLSYYHLGKSLANGTGYSSITGSQITPHTHFPPGYPIIISTIFFFTESIIGVKILNGAFFFGALFLGLLIFEKILGSRFLAFLLTAVLLLNRELLTYSSIMMSEIPFLFFLMLGVYMYQNLEYDKVWYRNVRLYGLLTSGVLLFYIRSFGIIFLLAVLASFAMQRRKSYLMAYALGFALLVFPWSIRNYLLSSGGGYLSQLTMVNPYNPGDGSADLSSLFERLSNNFVRYLDKEMVYTLLSFVENDYSRDVEGLNIVFSLIVLILVTLGIIRIMRNQVFFASLFISAGGILLLWPSEWFGVRFILPMTILILGFTTNGLIFLFERTVLRPQKALLTAVLLIVLIIRQIPNLSAMNESRNEGYPDAYADYFKAAQWINENTDSESIIACRKPELFYYYAQRATVRWPSSATQDELIDLFNKNGVDYLVVDFLGYSSTADIVLPLIRDKSEKFEVVKKFDKTVSFVCRYTPYMGYTGELSKGKKNGFGIYAWPNGTTYRGEWKNDQRHGRGIMTRMGSKKELHGIWRNDSLVTILNK